LFGFLSNAVRLAIVLVVGVFVLQWLGQIGVRAQGVALVAIGFLAYRGFVGLVGALIHSDTGNDGDPIGRADTLVEADPVAMTPRDRALTAAYYIAIQGVAALLILHTVASLGFSSDPLSVQFLGILPITLYMVLLLGFNLNVIYLFIGPIARTRPDSEAAELTWDVGEHILSRVLVLGLLLTEAIEAAELTWDVGEHILSRVLVLGLLLTEAIAAWTAFLQYRALHAASLHECCGDLTASEAVRVRADNWARIARIATQGGTALRVG
jgi:hypothetical protein